MVLKALRDKIFRTNGVSSNSAKSRLHFVLVQDRTGLTAERLASFKKEMVEVIQRYFVIDESGFDVSYKRDTGVTTLIINSPIVVRREASIGGMVGSEMSQKKAANAEAPA